MGNPLQDYAVMVICAADVDQIWHDCTGNGANPQANPTLPTQAAIGTTIGYVHDGNFDVLGQLRCNDAFITNSLNVYYGLVLCAKQHVGPMNPGDLLVAVRGTMDQLEWLNDASALAMCSPNPVTMKGQVGVGFWDIYQSMQFGGLAGNMQGRAIDQLTNLANQHPGAAIFICGHSLGAALATYLAYDFNHTPAAVSGRVRPYFFASPKTGTGDWVDWCQKQMLRYDLANYALDFVPMVPPDGEALNPGGPGHNVHIIPARAPGALDAGLLARFDVIKNHSPIGYALMLDLTNPVAQRLNPNQPAPAPGP